MIYYKVAHIENEEEGLYSSSWEGHEKGKNAGLKLKYKIGYVTITYEGPGIQCWGSLEEARRHARQEEFSVVTPVAILAVRPVHLCGAPAAIAMSQGRSMNSNVSFRAVEVLWDVK